MRLTVYHEAETIPEPDYTFTVSARGKLPSVPVITSYSIHYTKLYES